ncbi:MAG: N-acetyltransferase family protein [Saprospiraceae bacterium]|nr:N-acetyltransferase family protein [Saprospiraceae bacterium]
MLKFRDATIQDLEKIVEIYNTTIAGRMVTADVEPIKTSDRTRWFYEHTPDKRPLWMVENEENEENELIGWVSFQSFYGRPAYDATAEISIYLDPEKRGQGYGKRVLQYAMSQANNYGITTILGFIFAHNAPSIELFLKLGFEEWANLKNIAVLDGVERSLKILGKRL